jgi:membrane associated rhomboid family serine protease
MKVEYNSPVILTYAIICTVVLVIDAIIGGNLMPFFTVPGSLDGYGAKSVFVLFSHVIGHGSAAHLMGNFTMILLIGPIVEEKYGSPLLLAMIGFTALLTGALNVLLF